MPPGACWDFPVLITNKSTDLKKVDHHHGLDWGFLPAVLVHEVESWKSYVNHPGFLHFLIIVAVVVVIDIQLVRGFIYQRECHVQIHLCSVFGFLGLQRHVVRCLIIDDRAMVVTVPALRCSLILHNNPPLYGTCTALYHRCRLLCNPDPICSGTGASWTYQFLNILNPHILLPVDFIGPSRALGILLYVSPRIF